MASSGECSACPGGCDECSMYPERTPPLSAVAASAPPGYGSSAHAGFTEPLGSPQTFDFRWKTRGEPLDAVKPGPVQYETTPDLRLMTVYPDDNPKSVVGLTKPSLHQIPPVALVLLGQAMKDGEAKYGLMNWRGTQVAASVYYDAIMRHMLAWWDGEAEAQDSGVAHLAHVMACCAILLDATALGRLNDDRPKPGNVSALMAALTKPKP